jgi:hypothetical protein
VFEVLVVMTRLDVNDLVADRTQSISALLVHVLCVLSETSIGIRSLIVAFNKLIEGIYVLILPTAHVVTLTDQRFGHLSL